MTTVNLLPYDGQLLYWPGVFDQTQANGYLDKLMEQVDWKPDEVMMFGKLIVTKRKMAWYGDEGAHYRYSGIERRPMIWTPLLIELKEKTELVAGEKFNSCLLNLYHNGSESMGWHSDNEPELRKNGTIASLSLGPDRKFSFKHRSTGEKISVLLEHGSLLLMQGVIQKHWLHQLPPMKKVSDPRINLTFRQINRH